MWDIRIVQTHQESGFPWEKTLDWGPHVFWAAVALAIFFFIGPGRIREAFSRATKIGFAGIEVEFKSEIEAAAKARALELPPQLRDRLARRIERLQPLVAAARILWIDDKPRGNTTEIDLLHKLGAAIDLAQGSRAASERLESAVYDLVLSDIGREDDAEAGLKFMPQVAAAILGPPLIFYTAGPRPLPPGAFGLTHRPDELFHLILDALERRRG